MKCTVAISVARPLNLHDPENVSSDDTEESVYKPTPRKRRHTARFANDEESGNATALHFYGFLQII